MTRRRRIINAATYLRSGYKELGFGKRGIMCSLICCYSCGRELRGRARLVEIHSKWSASRIVICVPCARRVGIVAEHWQ